MDPLVLWIMAHGRDVWRSPETRAAFEAQHGPLSEARWNAAQNQAQRQARAVNALESYRGETTIRFALSHIIATPRTVSVPLRIVGHDANGATVSLIVTATVEPLDTLNDLWAQAAYFAQEAAAMYGIQISAVYVHQGIHVL